MSVSEPVIAFGQQPCGFFPRRYLAAKIRTALRLRAEIGGRVVFFYHDSDHDPRETCTVLREPKSGKTVRLNFLFTNKIQKKHSPLYSKQIAPDWKNKTERQLPKYLASPALEAFRKADAANPADFCLQIYRAMGLLNEVEVVRSSDPEVRRRATRVEDCFADVPYQGEIVRARMEPDGRLRLHRGGEHFIELPPAEVGPEQISPARDTRLRWMQSILHCTHYIAGAGEQAYLNTYDTPEIQFINREEIDRPDEALTYENTEQENSYLRSPSGRH